MVLMAILTGTLLAGIGSVWLAALLGFGVLARYTQHMLSLAAGALLATAFLHLLPEAFEGLASARDLFLTLLVGLLFFFLLDKAELWHHGHEHHGLGDPDHGSGHGHDHHALDADRDGAAPVDAAAAAGPQAGSWAVLTGDSVHCFGDGILIASAFMADMRLGAIAALAVLAHEVPHHIGDLVVLQQVGGKARVALLKVSLAGAMTSLGGVAGFLLLAQLHQYLPYFLVVAASSFVYVALADLIPQLQRHLSARQTLAQIAWLLVGIGLVTAVSSLAH